MDVTILYGGLTLKTIISKWITFGIDGVNLF
jgi:hypothetical protein